MNSTIIYFLLLLLLRRTVSSIIIDSNVNKFPDDFLFGASTAAYQIEGGWNTDGKGPSIWDQFTHEHPELIVDHSNGDIGPDSYHFYEDDIKALKDCGLNFYRFSIAWSRILPNGDITSINEMGLKYYHKLIDKLIENDIEPMITMYHYDLPQSLMNVGGLMNDVIQKYFEDYAMLLFNEYGNRVKWWITFNEPFDFCVDGYGGGGGDDDDKTPPLLQPVLSGIGEYLCVDNVLKSHAIVYHLYKRKYSHFNGKIGISLSSRFFYPQKNPNNNNNDTLNIVDRAMQYQLGWLAHPLFIGDYPPIMIREIAGNSIREGRFHSRLPQMSDEWKYRIKGSLDFLGLNYYTSRLIEYTDNSNLLRQPSWAWDAKLNMTIDPSWIQAKSKWLYMVPKGFGDILRWLRDEYDNPEIIITENGWSDDGEQIDTGRITYLREHLNELLKAINIDKCNVTAYTIWSIIDNFEWNRGYSEKFGLYSVNLNSTNKERTAKKSAHFFKDIIQYRIVPSN